MAFATAQLTNSAPMSEINITPLVDVMLTVLIIFMVTAPIMTHKIDLPLAGSTDKKAVEARVLAVSIKDSGEIFLDGQPVNRTSLDLNLRIAAANGGPIALQIRPEAHSAYDNLAAVLAIAQSNRVTDLRVESLALP